jgi:hypothetical protein
MDIGDPVTERLAGMMAIGDPVTEGLAGDGHRRGGAAPDGCVMGSDGGA